MPATLSKNQLERLASWAQAEQWRVLDTNFGSGQGFLKLWETWQQDPQRPPLLHVVAVSAQVPDDAQLPQALIRLSGHIQLGFNRFSFSKGQVLLTLCIGSLDHMLSEQQFEADIVLLKASSLPSTPTSISAWTPHTAKLLSRCCRRGTIFIPPIDLSNDQQASFQTTFQAAGFKFSEETAQFDPPWTVKRRFVTVTRTRRTTATSRCVVIGSGLAGACTAASLARRGWQVQVLDAAPTPASGASGLPAGLYAPYLSADNSMLARLTLSGVNLTAQLAKDLLNIDSDWQPSGVMQLADDASSHWHEHAGWINPSRLVTACLAQTGVTWQGQCRVARIEKVNDAWTMWNDQGQRLAEADLLIIAAAHASAALLEASGISLRWPLQTLRGQVTYNKINSKLLNEYAGYSHNYPVNGHGSFIPQVPTEAGDIWVTGATYERDNISLTPTVTDQVTNFEKLQTLLPQMAEQLKPEFVSGQVHNWVGIRCTTPDRLPLVGELAAGLWVCTALASRGLTLAPLCAELLAAQLHGEPLPLDKRQTRALGIARLDRLKQLESTT